MEVVIYLIGYIISFIILYSSDKFIRYDKIMISVMISFGSFFVVFICLLVIIIDSINKRIKS